MSAKLPTSRVAKALADATLMNDIDAAKKNGISVRSLDTYRKKLEPDSALAFEVQRYLNEQDETWAADLPVALKATLKAMTAFGDCPQGFEPETIEAIGKQLAVLSDVEATREIIKARLNA